MMRVRKQHGFSLLEVMVALAILAMTLTALFAAEVGAFKAGHSAHRMTEGTLLARCKMAEIEADLNENGLPLNLVEEEDEACCADEESDVFSCSWKIEPLEVGALERDELSDDTSPLGGLLGDSGGGEDEPAAMPTAEDMLAGGAGGNMVAGMATEFVWPLIAPTLAAQVRRVTVEVKWGERGGFDVVQFVVVEPGLGASTAGTPGVGIPGAGIPGAGIPATTGSTP